MGSLLCETKGRLTLTHGVITRCHQMAARCSTKSSRRRVKPSQSNMDERRPLRFNSWTLIVVQGEIPSRPSNQMENKEMLTWLTCLWLRTKEETIVGSGLVGSDKNLCNKIGFGLVKTVVFLQVVSVMTCLNYKNILIRWACFPPFYE